MAERKPWSISTTVRNPERIREFLKTLKLLEGEKWSYPAQEKFQILLIQYKFYGYGSAQFCNDLSSKHASLMNNPHPVEYKEAQEIFKSKRYEDPPMRGRQSFNPLKKMGLTYIDSDKKVRISSFGNYFLKEDYDIGEVFFRYFLKWQYPNPIDRSFTRRIGFDINPFLASLHLINTVNRKWSDMGNKPVGVSKEEFCLFFPTLINYKNILKHTDKLIYYRLESRKKSGGDLYKFRGKFRYDFAGQFFNTKDHGIIKKKLSHLHDYGDNAIRYFRLTRFIHLRGDGRYVDLEPRRHVEVESLLSKYSGAALDFKNKQEYMEYLVDKDKPQLPWLTKRKLSNIVKQTAKEISKLQKEIVSMGGTFPKKEIKDITNFSEKQLEKHINKLRTYRRELQFTYDHFESQKIDKIKKYIEALQNIPKLPGKNSILLEKYITMALNALNDAIKIQPNYPLGDDNEPIFTAPAGVPDIECYYDSFDSICEVTMLTTRQQWYNEGQPVMRHLRNFEERIADDKNGYCVFVAPSIHKDTVNTFWFAVKYEYEGNPQKIIPLTITQIIELLKFLIAYKESGKVFSHRDLKGLYDKIISLRKKVKASDEWLSQIPSVISQWKRELVDAN